MCFINPKLEKIFNAAELIIFDMNGLIIDDEGIQFKAFNKVLKNYNLKISENFWIDKCVGHKEVENFLKIFSLKNIHKDPIEIKRLIKEEKQVYEKLVQPQVKKIVRKGVLEIIKYIKNKTNKKIALATSSTKQGCNIVLGSKGLNIKDKFDFIISGDQIKKSKPNPEIYFKVRKHFNIKASKCLVFEDSFPGVNAAKNAKMFCFAIPSKYTRNQDFSRADFVISDLSKKAKILS